MISIHKKNFFTISVLFAFLFTAMSTVRSYADDSQIPRMRGNIYEKVELEKPVQFIIQPLASSTLIPGEEKQFKISFSGAPKPIHMFSSRIEYTSPSLSLSWLKPSVQKVGQSIVISDPYVLEEDSGLICRSISGISLEGWEDGDLLFLGFSVPSLAENEGSMRIAPHPAIREGLAHDSLEEYRTYDYERQFVYDECLKMPVLQNSDAVPPAE